tara:strand:+ start:29882 stop:30424 length:543 start_codon:yes stop_codon:yes gene_type:complete
MKKFVVILSLIIAIVSCKSELTQTRLGAIKSLQAQVDSSAIMFQTIDIAKIKDYKTNAKTQLDFLEKNNHDTIFDHLKYIDVYYANFKLMRKLVKGHERLAAEIEFSTSQLTHLYNDVENGFSGDSNYVKHFDSESKAVSKIVNSTAVLKDWEERTVKRYNGMVAPIDSIILVQQNLGYR